MLADITAALRRGDSVAALAAARTAVAAQPENAQAQHLLGLALQKTGDLEGARAAIDRAISLSPDRAMFQLSRASLALGDKDLSLAEQGMKEALALDPNQLPAYVALVHMALAQGRNDEAAKYLRLAQRVNADDAQVLVAEGHVATLAGRADDALKCFTAAAKADPRYALAQVSLGIAYMQRGLWAFAEQTLSNALALDAGNPGVLRALTEVYRRQEKLPEALATLDRLIALRPSDAPSRAVRGQLRLASGQTEAALADFLAVLEQHPSHAQILPVVLNLYARAGNRDAALALIERALATTARDDVWMLRLGLTGHLADLTREVLQRWQAALPDSAFCQDRWAHYFEALGDSAQARTHAERALAIDDKLPSSQLLLVRADLLTAPEAALARLERLAPSATSPEAQRMVLGWMGLANDYLGRYPAAADAWREMIRHVPNQLPVPKLQAATEQPEGEAAGHLLWGPPGVRMERILQALDPVLPGRLLAERISPAARQDGYGPLRALPGDAEAGSARRWRDAITALGRDPATVVDWLPHFDPYTASSLPGAKWVAVVADPRDTLLNWLVFGSAQGYLFLPNSQVSANWLALSHEALADHRDAHPEAVAIVHADGLDSDPAALAAELGAALGLAEAPSAEVLGRAPKALGGLPNQFPVGHWRHYAEAFAEEFARLAPVAERLGY